MLAVLGVFQVADIMLSFCGGVYVFTKTLQSFNRDIDLAGTLIPIPLASQIADKLNIFRGKHFFSMIFFSLLIALAFPIKLYLIITLLLTIPFIKSKFRDWSSKFVKDYTQTCTECFTTAIVSMSANGGITTLYNNMLNLQNQDQNLNQVQTSQINPNPFQISPWLQSTIDPINFDTLTQPDFHCLELEYKWVTEFGQDDALKDDLETDDHTKYRCYRNGQIIKVEEKSKQKDEKSCEENEVQEAHEKEAYEKEAHEKEAHENEVHEKQTTDDEEGEEPLDVNSSPKDEGEEVCLCRLKKLIKVFHNGGFKHCPISGEPFDPETILGILPCGHYAELQSLKKWFILNGKCIICRAQGLDYLCEKGLPSESIQGQDIDHSLENQFLCNFCGPHLCIEIDENFRGKFVLFYASWCHHSNEVKPVWDELVKEFPDLLVSVDENEEKGKKHGINSYPTIIYYPKNSEEQSIEYKGDRSKEDLNKFILNLK